MASNKVTVRVLTPLKHVCEQQVDYAVLRCEDGDMGILPGHQPCAVVLGYGQLRLYHDNQQIGSLLVMGGVATVRQDTVTVLSELAGGVQEVEAELVRLEQAKEERRQEELRSSVDIQRAEVALRNALVHLDVSSYSVLSSMREQQDEETKNQSS